MPAAVIGIDLGTTFTCAACYQQGKEIDIIPNEDGDRIIPSVVYFDPNNGSVLVGKNANDEIPECQRNGLFDAKRIIGRQFHDEYVSKYVNSKELPFSIVCGENGKAVYEVTIGDEKVHKTPEEVSAEILKYIKQAASEYLGSEVTEAVISIPARFSNSQRKATKKAAELAGLKVLKLITEPTAAAIYYASKKEKNNTKLLVFDFGGGTLDVSLMKIIGKQFQVKAVYGDTFLGGRDIDQILFDHFYEECIKNQNLSNSRKRTFLRRLRLECVEIKKKLSTRLEAKRLIVSPFGGDEEMLLNMSREVFENLTEHIFQRAFELVKLCLSDSGTLKSDIKEVVLVGGTVRIPKIRDMLINYFGSDKIKTDVHPDEAIAAGASLQAALLKKGFVGFEKFEIKEVTPLSLGIETQHNIMEIFIPKNSPIPYKVSKRKHTTKNEQKSVRVAIFEGERKNIDFNNYLGEFIIKGFPMKRVSEVEYIIDFELDEDGVINVKATEESTGVSNKLAVTMGEFRLSERKVKISEEEAQKHKLEDDMFENFGKYYEKMELAYEKIRYDVKELTSETNQDFVIGHYKEFLNDIKKLKFTEIQELKRKSKNLKETISHIFEDKYLSEIFYFM